MLLGTLQNFSTQELVDCVTTCSGCGGGNVSRACIYLKTNEEILWDDYPYTGSNGTCQYSSKPLYPIECSSYLKAPRGGINSMKNMLQSGILSVGVDASSYAFHSYSGGIFNNPNCGTQIDHAPNVVGWGTDSVTGVEYWIVRNSWGTSWGEQGYMQIEISSTVNNGDGYCGIQKYAEQLTPKNV
jgi:C1A family cysteine protease